VKSDSKREENIKSLSIMRGSTPRDRKPSYERGSRVHSSSGRAKESRRRERRGGEIVSHPRMIKRGGFTKAGGVANGGPVDRDQKANPYY